MDRVTHIFHRLHGPAGLNNTIDLSYFNVGSISQLHCAKRLFSIRHRDKPYEIRFRYLFFPYSYSPLVHSVARRFSTESEVLDEIKTIQDKQLEMDQGIKLNLI